MPGLAAIASTPISTARVDRDQRPRAALAQLALPAVMPALFALALVARMTRASPGRAASRSARLLSGGQTARIGIARAIALDLERVILDEPTASERVLESLDADDARELIAVILHPPA